MIRIWRGEEPPALTERRDSALATAEIAYQKTGERPPVAGYQVARDTLYARQHHKCAWCDRDECDEGLPVEHYRPKGGADVAPCPQRDDDDLRYFWLGWTWENLLFSCVSCNGRSAKGVKFPLAPDTAPLPILDMDVSKETHWLVDPARDNPRDHIRFHWDQRIGRWCPYPFDPKGACTLDVLGLNRRDSILSIFARHVKDLDAIRAELEENISGNDQGRLQGCWERWTRRLFDPTSPFHSLSYDYLEHHFPEPRRRQWGLRENPTPGDFRPPIPSRDVAHPELDGWAPALQLQIRALGKDAPRESLRAAIRALCDGDGCTRATLASTLRRSEGHLRRILDEMIEDGELGLNAGLYHSNHR